MSKETKDMKAGDMSVSMIIMVMGDMQDEADSLEIRTRDHDDQSSASRATTKVNNTQIVHTKTGPT